MGRQVLREGRHHILFDPDFAPHFSAAQFEPDWWLTRGGVVGQAPGRGAVSFVRAAELVWALRHYRRGGWAAKISGDRYLWTGLESSRPWREWTLTARLRALGLPVPEPVAAHVARHGLLYTGDLFTRRIDGARTLAEVLSGAPLPPQQWRALGATLRRFHDAGLRHDDINARNLLLDADGRFHLIDFDKAALGAPGAAAAANLARLHRSLRKFAAAEARFAFQDADWQALQAGHRGESAGVDSH